MQRLQATLDSRAAEAVQPPVEVEKEEEESGYDELEPLSTLHLTPVGKDGGGEKKDWPVDVDDPLS